MLVSLLVGCGEPAVSITPEASSSVAAESSEAGPVESAQESDEIDFGEKPYDLNFSIWLRRRGPASRMSMRR
jgi:hypothetical protein